MNLVIKTSEHIRKNGDTLSSTHNKKHPILNLREKSAFYFLHHILRAVFSL